MPEDKRSYVDDVLDDLFGLRPPSWVLVPQVVETMLHLAEAGRVILIGRGSTVATAQLPNVYHARIVAPLATRIKRVQQSHRLTGGAAAAFVEKEDRGRRRYVKSNFHARLDDELLYHLVINTGSVSFADAAEDSRRRQAVLSLRYWRRRFVRTVRMRGEQLARTPGRARTCAQLRGPIRQVKCRSATAKCLMPP